MSRDLISKKTRNEFREALVGWTLREIQMEFDAADLKCTAPADPNVPGQRRSFVDQYYRSMDFTNWSDVAKLLVTYENVITTIEGHNPQLAQSLLGWLERDGFTRKDGRLVPKSGMHLGGHVKSMASELNAEQIEHHIRRIEASINADPSLAIGSAKELVETCCKTILAERGQTVPDKLDVPQLVRQAMETLKLVPEGIPEEARGAKAIKALLGNLATACQSLTELRNLYGTGHGKTGRARGLEQRHARLAVGAATTLTVFLFDTHKARP